MNRLTVWLFGGSGGASPLADLGLLWLRLFSGITIAFAHGIGKLPPKPGLIETTGKLGFPLPELFSWAAGLAEFGGGILVAIGLLTRPAAAFLVFTMLVAAFGLHGADPFSDQELALLYSSIFFVYLLSGPGRFSLDALLRQRQTAAPESDRVEADRVGSTR